METVSLFFTVVVLSLAFAYYSVRRKYNYWQRRGVPCVQPEFPLGNMKGLGQVIHHTFKFKEFYDKMKGSGPFCGVYAFHLPLVVVLDVALVKHIMIKDFSYFTDRGLFVNEKDDPLSGNLFLLEGHKWKNMRAKITPTFTSGKMKFMYPTIVEVGHRLEKTLNDLVKDEAVLELKDLLARFTTDLIGTCGFGIECNSLKDPDSQFREMGRLIFEEPRHNSLITFLMQFYKDLALYFGMKVIRDDVHEFFMGVVKETVAYREKNNVHRNDFMDLLIELKNNNTNDGQDNLTIEEVAAQALIFFLAGFETSSSTLAYCLYELALNPEIQNRARREAQEVIKRHGGEWTYEAMMEMHYIDQVINETLRKYPPVSNLTRGTLRDYRVPDTDFVIEKGTQVWIPVYALQHDPEFYPDPEKFDPDRFTPEEVAKRDSILWLPFGEGPRNCVGLRFGMIQTRVGLIALLNNFEFLPSEKTKVPLEFATEGFTLTSKGGMWLKLKKITT